MKKVPSAAMEKIQRVSSVIKRMRPRSLSRTRKQAPTRQASSLPAQAGTGPQTTESDRAIALALQQLEGERPIRFDRPASGHYGGAPGRGNTTESDSALAAMISASQERRRLELQNERGRSSRHADDDAALARLIAAMEQHDDDLRWRPTRPAEPTHLRSRPTRSAEPMPDRIHTAGAQVSRPEAEIADDSAGWFTGVGESLFGDEGWLSGNWISDYFRGEVPPELACVACMDREADACMIPCGHVNLCMACAGKLQSRRCPVCRLEFQQIVKAGRRSQ